MPSFFATFAPSHLVWEKGEVWAVAERYIEFLQTSYICDAWRLSFGYGSRRDNCHFHVHLINCEVQSRTVQRRFNAYLATQKFEYVHPENTFHWRYEIRKGKFSDVDAYLDENELECEEATHTLDYTGIRSIDYNKEKHRHEDEDRILNIQQYFKILQSKIKCQSGENGFIRNGVYEILLREMEDEFYLHRIPIEEKIRCDEAIRRKKVRATGSKGRPKKEKEPLLQDKQEQLKKSFDWWKDSRSPPSEHDTSEEETD